MRITLELDEHGNGTLRHEDIVMPVRLQDYRRTHRPVLTPLYTSESTSPLTVSPTEERITIVLVRAREPIDAPEAHPESSGRAIEL